MTPYRVIVLRRAERDAEAIADWLTKRSPTGALRWQEAFAAAIAIDKLAENPLACSEAPERLRSPGDLRQICSRHEKENTTAQYSLSRTERFVYFVCAAHINDLCADATFQGFDKNMFFADLDTRCQVDAGPYIRAIGWLEKGRDFATGEVAPQFVSALRAHLKAPMQPVLATGLHQCDLCAAGKRVRGKNNVWIPTTECIYVAPELIVHYIEEHGYRPPSEFVAAVMDCPEQKSEAYFALYNRFPDWQERLKYLQRKD